MKKIILLILISVNYLYAQDTQISVFSDQKQYSIDETIDVSIKIVSNKLVELNDFPKVKNLKLASTPLHSTVHNYQYVNGVATSSSIVTYSLTYIPLKKGTAIIHPVKLKINGKLYLSNSLKLKIVDTIEPQNNDDLSKEDYEYKFDPELFIAARVDKPEVFVGEEVIVTYELYHRVDVNFAEQPVIPSFKNFWLEELDNSSFRRSKRKIYKGYYFKVIPLATMAIFPIKSGEMVLPAFKAKFKADIFSFGSSPNKIFKRTSNLVKLKVKPLPKDKKPKDFLDGNVGDYTFTVSVSKNKVKVNEPFTINMKIKGSGNVKNISLPKIKDIDGFKLYEPNETVNISNKGTIRGSKSITVAVKAEKPGVFEPFDFKFKYFNPTTEKYYTIDYSKLKITVEGKAINKIVDSNTNNISKNNDDTNDIHKISVSLKPISNKLTLSKDKNHPHLYSILIFSLLFFPLIYFLIYIFLFRKYKHINNKDIMIMKNSYKKAITSLKELEKGNLSSRDFYSELYSTIIDYIEEKFSIIAKGLTINQISIFLEEKDVKENYIKIITDILENSQYIKYSSVEVSDDEKKLSLSNIKNIIININRGE